MCFLRCGDQITPPYSNVGLIKAQYRFQKHVYVHVAKGLLYQGLYAWSTNSLSRANGTISPYLLTLVYRYDNAIVRLTPLLVLRAYGPWPTNLLALLVIVFLCVHQKYDHFQNVFRRRIFDQYICNVVVHFRVVLPKVKNVALLFALNIICQFSDHTKAAGTSLVMLFLGIQLF